MKNTDAEAAMVVDFLHQEISLWAGVKNSFELDSEVLLEMEYKMEALRQVIYSIEEVYHIE